MGWNMVFNKADLVGYDFTTRSLLSVDQSSPDFFAEHEKNCSKMYLSDFEYLYPFQRYSPLKFEVIQNWAKFCTF